MVKRGYRRLGEYIRTLRKQRGEPLRVVAAAIGVDSTLLSKIELGDRLPTDAQVVKLAQYFDIGTDELIARVIAEKIVADYGYEAATLRAITILREEMAAYGQDAD